ncbi:DnaJ domain-containing protein 9 [Elsinoe fawcettii]|nr:DnaJ domain-containing protein 9 [Elsinoe fawcettii]
MSRGPEKDAELDADFYAVFGVNSSATQAEIKKAYRRLVLAYHPDKTSGDTSKLNKFLELQVAFGVLTHVEAKNKYDRLRTARQERDAKATRAREQREQEREEAEGREQREQERKRQDEERKRREQEEKKRREREEAEKQRREEEERKQREAEAEEQRKQKELDKAKREESIKQRYAEEARRMRQRAERAENALDGVQCKGITLKGLRCRNWPSTTRLSHLHCHLHQPNYERWSCKGITQKGIICRLPPSRTLRHREYCHHHLAQAPEDHFSGSEDETETYKFSWSSAMPKTPPQDVLPLSSRRSSSNNPTPVTPLRRTQAGRSSPLTQHTTPTRPAPGPARSARPNVYAEQASSIPASPPTTPEPETNTPSKPSASSKVRPDQASHEDNDYFRTRRNSDRHKTPPTQNSSGHSEPESTRSRWQPTDHGMPTPPETPPEKRSNAISATTPDTSTPSSKVTPEMRESIKLFRKTIPPHLYSNRRKLGDYLAEMIVPRPSPTQGYIYAFKVEPYYRWAIPDTPPKPKLSVIQGYSRQLHAHSLVDILHEDNGEEDFWSSPRSQRQTIKIKIGRSKDVPRRIKEWIGQCKHDCVSVVSYPSLNVTAIEGDTPLDSILVDDVGRVERLLHLVLNDRNIKSERCGCGVLHREWFELEAGQEMADKLEQDIRTCIDLVRMTG